MKKLFLIVSLAFTTAFVGCNSEEREKVKEHETEIRTEDPQKEDLEIHFKDFEEVKTIGDTDNIALIDGKLYYSDGGENSELTLEDVEYEISIDNEPLRVRGNKTGGIYKATFTVENKEINVESREIQKYYYIDDETELVIEIK